jgi:hypothetical protein
MFIKGGKHNEWRCLAQSLLHHTVAMAAKQLRVALEKFAKSGRRESIDDFQQLLVSCEESGFGVDVSLRVALKVSELCVTHQEEGYISTAWFCLSFFLFEQTYAYAAQFADTFLRSSVARRAFELATIALDTLDGTFQSDAVHGYILRFLSKAVWQMSCRVYVLRSYTEAYTSAFEVIKNDYDSHCKLARHYVDDLLGFLLFGDQAELLRSEEHKETMQEFVLCGGLEALTSMQYITYTRADGSEASLTETRRITEYCTALFIRISFSTTGSKFPDPVVERFRSWSVVQFSQPKGMAVSFYAMFNVLMAPRSPYLDIKFRNIVVNSQMFWSFVLRHCPDSIVDLEQVFRYPFPDGELRPEETWLYKYLHITRKFKSPDILVGQTEVLRGCDVPWVVVVLDQFEALCAANKHHTSCAFPGCEVTGETALCPLRKCGRCLTTYYCGQGHQRKHWPEHRISCVKCVPGGAKSMDVDDEGAGAESGVVEDSCEAGQSVAEKGVVTSPHEAAELHCAYPGCGVTSATAQCPLGRCARCKAVHYCGHQHQKDHWQEHKKNCVKTVTG